MSARPSGKNVKLRTQMKVVRMRRISKTMKR